MKKYPNMVAVALLISCLSGNVAAATVSFMTPNPTMVSPGQNFTLTLQGTDFTLPAQGGAVMFNWDLSVLRYVDTTIPDSPWDTTFIDDAAALAGTSNQVDPVRVATSGAAQGPIFNIADITFQFVGNAGQTSPINLADATLAGGWSDSIGNVIPNVTYVNAQIQAVPLPGAFLLLASGIAGLAFFRKGALSTRSS